MGFRKKQVILAALVLALGTAVYLNWQFSSNQDLIADNSIMSTKELGEAQFVKSLGTKKRIKKKMNHKILLNISQKQKLRVKRPETKLLT